MYCYRCLWTKVELSELLPSSPLTWLEGRGKDTSLFPHGGKVCMFESEVVVISRALQYLFPKTFSLKIVLFLGLSNLLNICEAVITLRFSKASFQNISFASLAHTA